MTAFRFYHALEAIQYGFLYIFAAFLGGVGLDYIFPAYKKDEPTEKLVREIILQCLLLIVLVYCIRIIVKQVPILFPYTGRDGYVPYKSAEYSGEMMMGLIFLSSQLNLIAKIDDVSKRIYKALMKEERKVEHDL